MKSWKELFLFSTNTRLAYQINCEFYGCHWVWCSPVYNPAALDKTDVHSKIPASSAPAEIYLSYSKAIKTVDTHSLDIKNNRHGITRGATHKLNNGKISETDHARIINMVKKANLSDFDPMLYIIRYDLVKSRVETVSVKDSANPLGIEYRINDLNESEFEIIQPIIL